MTLDLAEGLVGREREKRASRTAHEGPRPDESSARRWEEGWPGH